VTNWEEGQIKYIRERISNVPPEYILHLIQRELKEFAQELKEGYALSDGWSFESDIKYGLKLRGIE